VVAAVGYLLNTSLLWTSKAGPFFNKPDRLLPGPFFIISRR
jgi:hypothetical protein